MTDRIQNLLQVLKSGEYKNNRSEETMDISEQIQGASKMMTSALRFRATLENETPYLHPGDRIGFNRSRIHLATYTTAEGKNPPHWGPGNIVPDYETLLNRGMEDIRREVADKLEACLPEQKEYYEAVQITLDAALAFADRCREDAKNAGAEELYTALCRVPRQSAKTLLDACVFMKFMTFTMRCNNDTHITLGRFDKYMRPFYYNDLAVGRSREELLELIEEFFVSINFDTDLYQGVQLGDNGQSMVLGGCDKDGNETFDDFSRLCMEASLELNLIDPKVNLRVNKNTPMELFEFGTYLTKQGLGFPQYCNDDVVIPGLIALGYAPEDASDYAVAACWEFIIPGKGFDHPNLELMNFPRVISQVVTKDLLNCPTYDDLLAKVKEAICAECDRLMEKRADFHEPASPYLSVYVQSCIASGKDISQAGAVYNNFGFHGAGIAVAADSLIAIRELIYEKGVCDKETLLDALEKNYEGYGELRNQLLSCPKMGNNDDAVDSIANELMETYSSYLNGKPNCVGGIYRAGTGSAQGYIYDSRKVGATPDGRKAFEPYGSSFSPALTTKLSGPLSCIQSFTKFDLSKIINGGPMTIEIHDTTFRNEEGIKKVAMLVKAFVDLGGHQLQLNSINRERLQDALDHPEDHKNLIVRVWGWSGYFIELDRPFQEHIMKRTEFMV